MRLHERFDVGQEVRVHTALIGCDLSPRQGVILHRLPRSGRMCDIAPMTQSVVDLAEVREARRRVMKDRNIAAKRLSKVAGLGETAVRDILEKGVEPRVGTLIKIADALDVPASSLFGSQVPVLGKIGAGGSVLFEQADEPELVDRPPGAVGKLMALRVAGDSMFPVYRDRDVIYVARDHEGVLPQYLGEECAVHTQDGGTYLKTLTLGSETNRYTLRSFNAPDMENVEVVWATPVLFVMRAPLKKV
jgi:phage repressor protein C with HTH and peptisase S24 domain